ncbi:MAG: hypothetical protein H0T59_11325 [Chloroflexi bacterium]|nr:hypothetical protein [Chloroflexota bacterium]MBA3586015.1 hypothetical protein [Chloroflexota bacterium]
MFGSLGKRLSLLLHVTQHEGRSPLVNRVRRERELEPIDFDYLDRWLGVLARMATTVMVGRR